MDTEDLLAPAERSNYRASKQSIDFHSKWVHLVSAAEYCGLSVGAQAGAG